MQWTHVGIMAGKALNERQCTLKEEAQYVNVQGNAHWEGVYRVEDTLGVQIFSLKLTN